MRAVQRPEEDAGKLGLRSDALLDCPTISARAAVRGGRALKSLIADLLMEIFRGAECRAEKGNSEFLRSA
jgi:hypothetical protein